MELTATRCPALDGDLLSTVLKLGKTRATCARMKLQPPPSSPQPHSPTKTRKNKKKKGQFDNVVPKVRDLAGVRDLSEALPAAASDLSLPTLDVKQGAASMQFPPGLPVPELSEPPLWSTTLLTYFQASQV